MSNVVRQEPGADFLRTAIRQSDHPNAVREDLVVAVLRVAGVLVRAPFCSVGDLRDAMEAVISVAESQARHESGGDLPVAIRLLSQRGQIFSLLANAKDRLGKSIVYHPSTVSGESLENLAKNMRLVGDPSLDNPLLSIPNSSVRGYSPLPAGALYLYAREHKDKAFPEPIIESSQVIIRLWEKLYPIVASLGFDAKYIGPDPVNQANCDHCLVAPFLVYRMTDIPEMKMDAATSRAARRRLSRGKWSIRTIMSVLPEFSEPEVRLLVRWSRMFSLGDADGADMDAPLSMRASFALDGPSDNSDAVLYGHPESSLRQWTEKATGLPVFCAAWGVPDEAKTVHQVIQHVQSADVRDIPSREVFVRRGLAAAKAITRKMSSGKLELLATYERYIDCFPSVAESVYAQVLQARDMESGSDQADLIHDAMEELGL